MKKALQNLSARSKARWLTIGLSLFVMVLGVYVKVPLVVWEKTVTDNAFLAVGFIGAVIAFGVIEGVKAWRGEK